MIVSHKHRFIFIKTRKTAGTSLEIALSAICGPDDIITPIDADDEKARIQAGGLAPQHYKVPFGKLSFAEKIGLITGSPRKSFYNHISAEEMSELLAPDVWNSYYKFCFERNPFDKVLSQYYARGGDAQFGSVMGYLKSGQVARLKGYDMYSIDRNVVVNDIFKFEEMDTSLAKISEKLSLNKPLEMPKFKAKGTRRTDKRPYQEVLTDKEKKLISIIFAREIKLLGYTF